MGRLSGFKYRQIIKRLRAFGFVFDRHAAGSHELWYNEQTDRYTTIPNHPGELPEGTLRAIPKQAGIEPVDFLKKL
jgi:predicted RNA binding protein YcfA (HicA-like mRNA interferase family)